MTGDYQVCFWKGYEIKLHAVFTDFVKAYDSTDGSKLRNIVDFHVHRKLIR